MGEHVEPQCPVCFRFESSGHKMSCTLDESPGYIPAPSFAEALAEPPHGRVGANEAVDEAVCQRIHGMSRAEWNASDERATEEAEDGPDDGYAWTDEFVTPWYGEGLGYP